MVNPLQVKERIERLKELPPLSQIAQEILAMVRNDDVDLSDFAKVVERDPSLMARLIGFANSAYYASPKPVTNVKTAIINVLGFRTTKNLVLGIVLSGAFQPDHCPAFDLKRYWYTVIVTATVAQLLAPAPADNKGYDGDDAYLAGLIYDLGLLALAHLYPEDLDQVLSEYEEDNLPALEERILEFNHYHAGAWLARNWRLPDMVVEVMENHANCKLSVHFQELCQLVKFCESVASYAYKGRDVSDLFTADIVERFDLSEEKVDLVLAKLTEQNKSFAEMANVLAC